MATARARPDDDEDVNQAPVFLWRARPGHGAIRLTAGAPDLPAGRVQVRAAARRRSSSA